MTEHVNITDPGIHEPKGISSAGANQVYVSNGAGSGAWKAVEPASIDMNALYAELEQATEIGDLVLREEVLLTGVIPDISTNYGTIIPVPSGTYVVEEVQLTLGEAITTANAVVYVRNASGSFMGQTTIPFSGSGRGDSFTINTNNNNTLNGPSWFEVLSDGGSTGEAPLFFTAVLRRN